MADENPGTSSDIKRDRSPNSDEELNIYSEKFNPLSFLYSDRTKIPNANAKKFDNVSMWYSNYMSAGRGANRGKKAEKSVAIERKWLPHQLPIESKRPKRAQKNVFTQMQSIQGPLATLRKYVEEKTRIKIVTRNEKGVRGHCMAFLVAFDKHFNLVLEDVDEVWRRSIVVKKSPKYDDISCTKPEDSKNRVKVPRIKCEKVSKNTEECRRHVDQMLMRGEHVVIIYVSSDVQIIGNG